MTADVSIRHATSRDRADLAALMHFGERIHRHLGWRSAMDFLGDEAFWVLDDSNGNLLAALAVPQDMQQVAWLRLFVCADRRHCENYWKLLWQRAQEYFQQRGSLQVAALVLSRWLNAFLRDSGFKPADEVVNLSLELTEAPVRSAPRRDDLTIRTMQPEDLPDVVAVDRAAFAPIWQNTLASLRAAYPQAVFATVAEQDERVVAYQICTNSVQGLHISRLAVAPDVQGQGIGRRLCEDLLQYGFQRGVRFFSVNTQRSNIASLKLYHHLGFIEDEEVFPVLALQT